MAAAGQPSAAPEAELAGQSANNKLGAAETLDLDNGAVGGGELDRHHAAGHYNRAASERRSRLRSAFREPGKRMQRIAHDVTALASADFPAIDRQSRRQLREIEPAPIAD